MYTVTCFNPIAKCGLERLPAEYNITEDVKEAQAILVRSASMHEMELPEGLLAVARAGAGVNNIPLDRCADQGIVVFNTPGANANGVKELTIAAMLLAARDITGGAAWVKENRGDENIGKTVEKAKKAFAGTEIAGKKLGVIGLGAIGAKVANAAVGLGMDVYGYDPYLSVQSAWAIDSRVTCVKTPEEIYQCCDYITVHVPLMDSTKGMLNQEAFSQMKDGAVILNMARDLLVNDDDMEQALKSGKIRKYVTDFPNAKTANMEGVLAIPHLGASTEESEDNCAVMACDELTDYLENGNIVNSVNYPSCSMGKKKGPARVAVFARGTENVIGQVSDILSQAGVGISAIAGNSRGDLSYTLADVDQKISDSCEEALKKIGGVLKVRVIQ